MITDYSPLITSLYSDINKAETTIRACDGFVKASWIRRAGAGHCNHKNYFHMTTGWNWAAQSIPLGQWRTNNWKTVERAFEPTNMLPVTFAEMASFNNQIYRANGLWNYPQQPGNDHCTSNIYQSDTGGLWALDLTAPPVNRECGMLLAHTDNFLYNGLGVRYTVNPPPTYFMPTDMWRRSATTDWELVNSNMRPRRSFVYFSWGNAIFIGCGRDDTRYPIVTDLNDFIFSTDGGITWQSLGTAPFRGAYGRRATPFAGGILLTGGAYGPDGTTADTMFLNEVWFWPNPMDINSLVALPPLPIAVIHHAAGVLNIDGVPTFGMIGGYNSNARPDGSPYGTIYTTNDPLTSLIPRHDSEFWID